MNMHIHACMHTRIINSVKSIVHMDAYVQLVKWCVAMGDLHCNLYRGIVPIYFTNTNTTLAQVPKQTSASLACCFCRGLPVEQLSTAYQP